VDRALLNGREQNAINRGVRKAGELTEESRNSLDFVNRSTIGRGGALNVLASVHIDETQINAAPPIWNDTRQSLEEMPRGREESLRGAENEGSGNHAEGGARFKNSLSRILQVRVQKRAVKTLSLKSGQGSLPC